MSKRVDAPRIAGFALNPRPTKRKLHGNGLVEPEPILAAATEAKAKWRDCAGLVAAWKGLEEGPVLDNICARLEELKESGPGPRPRRFPGHYQKSARGPAA